MEHQIYNCGYCNQKTNSISELTAHMQRNHAENKLDGKLHVNSIDKNEPNNKENAFVKCSTGQILPYFCSIFTPNSQLLFMKLLSYLCVYSVM